MKNPKFEIYTGGDGQFYFRLIAKNGQNILASEGYAAKSGCQNGIESVKKNAPLDERFERKTSTNRKYYFRLLAANKQVIGSSQMYASAQGREKGVAAVKRVAPTAPVDDTTA